MLEQSGRWRTAGFCSSINYRRSLHISASRFGAGCRTSAQSRSRMPCTALPMNEETQEDFEWLLREIVEGGGEAFVCEARLIDGLSDEDVRRLFEQARDADYEELAN